ncbi:UbiA family prenyltransferase [Streptomyces sp. NPDC056486]|uniref:UbiA family prenyltransferase n=1 Tax=Streptomyces sp. NPDC056486 TaxID=3345835 RepID=UPI0036B942BA
MVTNETPGATTRERRRMPGLRSAARWLRHEADLTRRMIADNLLVSVLPTVLFAVAAGTRYGLPAEVRLVGVSQAVALGLLAVYINDCSNQVHSGTEDAYNKPYRPIPAGLATAHGLARRYWLITTVYLLAGWVFGVWQWTLLWAVAVFLYYRWGSPRHYIWYKPAFNTSGALFPPASGWALLAPIDSTAWMWLAFVAVYFPLALIYEDVRDMEGDRAVGRRTLALVVGPTLVCRWFATLMVLLPFAFYFTLARASGAGDWKGIVCAAVLGALSWTCAARALLRHGHSADRFTYQLFYVTWGLTFATAPLLLARA